MSIQAPIPAHVPRERIFDIDMYALDGIGAGYHEAWKRIQKPGTPDLIWTPLTGGHWIATRGEIVREIYSDPARFSSEVIFLPKEAGEKYAMVPTRMDPPEHTPYREVLDKALNLDRIRKFEPRIRAAAAALIAGFAERGHCDFTTEFAKIFPVQVFMALADLPMKDVPYLLSLATDMLRPPGNTPQEMAEALDKANQGFFSYVEPFILARKGGKGDDFITIMVNSDIDGAALSHDKALGLISLVLLGGLDTVVNFLGFMMVYFARHPDKVAELGNVLRRNDVATLTRGVEELFRRFPVVSEARMVAKDIHYCGVDLKRGDMILLPTALHGLDESLNANPWDVDMKRMRISHTTFGAGPHRCAGMHLARLEVTVMLEEWIKRIPEFSLKPGTSLAYHAGIIAAVDNVQLVWP